LTPKGRRLIERAYAQHEIDMERAMKHFSREDRTVLIDLLKRLGKRQAEADLQAAQRER
jgi:MarR family transcriptional regulator, 2-MHQ and catechol-resistance regulon repressor